MWDIGPLALITFTTPCHRGLAEQRALLIDRHRGRVLVLVWGVPPRSPDLNPIEMFWSWVRRELRLRDLADMKNKRAPLGKSAYTLRLKTLLRGKRAQEVAGHCARKFRCTCLEVMKNKGAAAGN